MNGCKVTGCCNDTIPASQLQNGQFGVIVSNTFGSINNGLIVTRHQFAGVDHLTLPGKKSFFSSRCSELTGDKCRVRVLKAGEQITVC